MKPGEALRIWVTFLLKSADSKVPKKVSENMKRSPTHFSVIGYAIRPYFSAVVQL